MTNHKQPIDQQIRDLESKTLPDLSHIDQHWKQLDSSRPVNWSYRKPLFWVASVVMIALLLILVKDFLIDSKVESNRMSASDAALLSKDTIPTGANTVIKVNDSTTITSVSSLVIDSFTSTIISTNKTVKHSFVAVNPHLTDRSTLLYRTPSSKTLVQARTSAGVDTVIEVKHASTDITNTANSSLLLEDFFTQLTAPSQTFQVNNLVDTILIGKSGSMLSIPAKSFGDKKNITIVLTEYYTKEEFVCNRLVTIAGSEPLVSGGMVKIEAFENGKEINLTPGKKICWYVANKGNDLSNMQLFEGKVGHQSIKDTMMVEKIFNSDDRVDWIAREKQFTRNVSTATYKVLDLRNTPYKTRSTTKGDVGYFVMDPNLQLTKSELKDSLKTKYSYKKVVVRSNPRQVLPFVGRFFIDENRRTAEAVGDSTWVDSTTLVKLGYSNVSVRTKQPPIVVAVAESYVDPIYNMPALKSQLNGRYGVELDKLGWLNCDRFNRDPRPKSPLYVEIQDELTQYSATLIFKNLNGCLPGMTLNGTTVIFNGIPTGEELILVCVGVKNGKIWSSVQSFVSGKEKILLSGFTETVPETFKQKLNVLNK